MIRYVSSTVTAGRLTRRHGHGMALIELAAAGDGGLPPPPAAATHLWGRRAVCRPTPRTLHPTDHRPAGRAGRGREDATCSRAWPAAPSGRRRRPGRRPAPRRASAARTQRYGPAAGGRAAAGPGG